MKNEIEKLKRRNLGMTTMFVQLHSLLFCLCLVSGPEFASGTESGASARVINVNDWENLYSNEKEKENGKVLANFPEAKIENVYKEWKPVNSGHPMRDPTVLYAPPSLERVVFQGSFAETDRSSRASDSVEDVGTSRSSFVSPSVPVVIRAERKINADKGKYSVYGSPDINYSQYYKNPPKSGEGLLPEEQLIAHADFQREYYGSAVESRSADPYQELSFFRNEDRSSSLPQRFGGGLQYTNPPKTDTYRYYFADEKPQLSIDPRDIYSPAASRTADKVESRANRRDYDVLPTSFDDDASAVVYTFERDNGQKQKVGVIFKRDNVGASQINRIFNSNKDSILRNPKKYTSSLRPIPISFNSSPPTFRPNVKEPSHSELVSGKISHVYHGYKYHQTVPPAQMNYPLGNPFANTNVQARPKFFKPQKSPPIYKIAPHRLEGVFGPAIPKLDRGQSPPPSSSRSVRRNDVESRIVYKTVRDIEYSQPSTIFRVKESGELYNPRLDTLSAPPGKEGRIVLTTASPWRPDFSDALSPTEKFNLIPSDRPKPSTTTTSRPLKFPQLSKPKRKVNVKKENDKEASPNLLVIGFNYDDNPRHGQEFQDFEDEDINEKSPQEIYRLCLLEVPEYLRNVLCPPLLEKEKRSRNIQDNESQRSKKKSPPAKNTVHYSGFNVQLPSQENQAAPKLSVIRSQSKIKIYKPSDTKVSPDPTNTTTTTTTPNPTSPSFVEPITDSTPQKNATSTTTKKNRLLTQGSSESDKEGLLSRLSDYFFSERISQSKNSNNTNKKRIRRKGARRKEQEESIEKNHSEDGTSPSPLVVE
ncbi:uncharacterized protein [Lepeophtheirus salmonis]|uniref:uncharacterized protein n=1 Tax=Lepeophtheirus salmonis TaxID=72036 RepID=UPI001AE37313|nr:uncharacterized protein LOC121118493 [Lepeophtheirus salmonis]